MADPVAKSGSKPAASTPTAPAPSAPAPAPNGAPAPQAKQSVAPPTTVDEVIERAEDRALAKGSTVRVSPDNPDVASKARKDELSDSLEACGIKLVWDSTLAKDAIAIDPPPAKKGR